MPTWASDRPKVCAAHTVHDGFSDVTYVLLPLLASVRFCFVMSRRPEVTF